MGAGAIVLKNGRTLDATVLLFQAAMFWLIAAILMNRGVRRTEQLDKAVMELKFQQQERMAALGKISAGLAHELNNPVAASLRVTRELKGVLDAVEAHSMTLTRSSLTTEQAELLSGIKEEVLRNQDASRPLEPIRESELESELSNWFEKENVADGWKLAPTLAEANLSVEQLETLAGKLPRDAHEIAFQWLERSLAAASLLHGVRQSNQRIAEIVGVIKSFSYMDQSAGQAVDIHKGLDDTLTILGHKLKKNGIVVERDYDPDLPQIEADGAELNQLWTNLIDNAIDAVGPEGSIWLCTEHDTDAITVEVIDNGPGIPEEIQSRIFDPFFTTKDVGEGTGLGLQIVHRIVYEKYKGEIFLDSEPGATRFQIRLPISHDDPSHVATRGSNS